MLWGIGSVLFGLSVTRIGVALTYSLIIGLTAAIGSILPLLLVPLPSQQIILPFTIGIALVFIGLTISAYSGTKKEKQQKTQGFKLGLILAIISGITSSMLNIGFVYGNPIQETAFNDGINPQLATLPIWNIVLLGGFTINFGYATYRLFKNKTHTLFTQNPKKPLTFTITSAIFFFAGLAIYGIASPLLASLGTSIGWALLMSIMIVISNVSSILTKEWKNSKQALKYQLTSILILIFGKTIMGLSLHA